MGKRRGEDRTVHLHLFPLDSVHKLVSVFHTLPPTPRAIFIQCNVHCRQWTHHNSQDAVMGTEPSKAPTSHLLLLSAQGKSQCHLCFSGSEAFLFISVHLGHSLPELIVLFFYRFFVCLFLKKEFRLCSTTITNETESSCLPPAQHLAQTGLCTASL